MTRTEAIQIIRSLYPPDADYPQTAAIGQKLLEQARRDCASWENEPDAILFRLAALNLQRENKS